MNVHYTARYVRDSALRRTCTEDFLNKAGSIHQYCLPISTISCREQIKSEMFS
jgi:hypothetical protein